MLVWSSQPQSEGKKGGTILGTYHLRIASHVSQHPAVIQERNDFFFLSEARDWDPRTHTEYWHHHLGFQSSFYERGYAYSQPSFDDASAGLSPPQVSVHISSKLSNRP